MLGELEQQQMAVCRDNGVVWQRKVHNIVVRLLILKLIKNDDVI
jgi:hypothetical protein